MFYTVYKITNIVNDKIYIGTHITDNLNDNYFGSGRLLKKAIIKYGKSNFKKEILFIFESSKEMFDKEKELVNEDFVKQTNNYNLIVGGYGGFEYINRSGKNGNDIRKYKLETDLEWREKYSEKLREAWENKKKNGYVSPYKGIKRKAETIQKMREANIGRKHSENTKTIIGIKNSINQSGEKNHMYNKRWIHFLETGEAKLVSFYDVEEYLRQGWQRGKSSKSRLK